MINTKRMMQDTPWYTFLYQGVLRSSSNRDSECIEIIVDNLTLIGINSCVKWSFIKSTEANHLPYFISHSTFNNDTKGYKTQHAK